MNPTVYKTLSDEATRKLNDRAVAMIDGILGEATGTLKSILAGELASAYMEGVRDGFGQGVAAENARAAGGDR